MNFKQLWRLLWENACHEVPYKFLPSSPPYAFWISPSGKIFHGVCHVSMATELAENLYNRNVNMHRSYEFLYEKGWIRLVKQSIISSYYASGSYQKKTPAAFRTAKDIAMFYDYGLEEDFD